MYWFCFWAWRLSTEHVVAQPLHLYLFPQVWKCWKLLSLLLPCISLWDLIRWCKYTSEWRSSSGRICNSFLRMYVISNTEILCIAFHLSRSVRPYEPTICQVVATVKQPCKYLYSFCYAWLYTPNVRPIERCTPACGRWAVEINIYCPLSLTGSFYQVFMPEFGPVLGETLSVCFENL